LLVGVVVLLLVACDGGYGVDEINVVDTTSEPPPPCDACDPIAQTGCIQAEKCTWLRSPKSCGPYAGCIATGEVLVGEACEIVLGADNCVKGAICSGGICKTICDHQADPAASGCSAIEQCVVDAELFDGAAGVCEAR
jgi:hypothetical protein